jgi:endogenous inhibitor of DNA gyrase (YacG/DUF329 family)
MARKESKIEQFKCPECGHNRCKIDRFAQLNGVRRLVPGNACCAKCGKPVPWDVA